MKLIAETAWHHDGDYSFMCNLVTILNEKAKFDILKFHLTLDLDEYMMETHPAYNVLKKKIFTSGQWEEILKLVGHRETLLLFNDIKAIELGMKYRPANVEIHSVCLNDFNMLDCLKEAIERETKIFLGVGGSSLYEIEHAINRIGSKNIVLMFGFQNYPTNYEDIGFEKMKRIMRLFPEFEFGYADHCGWNELNNVFITLLGAAIGVQYIEKHVTTEYGKERIDGSSAISIDMFNEIADKMKILEKCTGTGNLELNHAEKKYSVFGPMKKAAMLKAKMEAGDILTSDNIHFKRTDIISDLSQVDILGKIGKKVKVNINENVVLFSQHFED